ncbi:MAG TPA: hypothetical protein VFZ21_08210, partial [Gemmatimonadaceae bacterium]|nr:hypothetical protein [Gemmatimonadaceae bacterium]
LLAAANDEVDPGHKFYHFELMTNMKGYRRYRRHVRTRAGRDVRIFFHANVLVRPDLSVDVRDKPLPPPEFRDYEDYLCYLRAMVAGVAANASDAARTVPFTPLATISSGYDSPACALLARDVGASEAITFGRARPGYNEEDDSGSDIAERIGLRVLEFDRLEYLRLDSLSEAEFLAGGTGGEEVVFAPLERVLPRTLFFTGYLGDAVWNRVTGRVNTELLMLYPGGGSLGEFRLRVGFVHFPVPTAGYIRHPSIFTISNSPAMRPWALGNDYDRPIPRRMLEEIGVPRESFGRTKKAITQPLWFNKPLSELMAPPSYAAFSRFVSPIPLFRGPVEAISFRAMRLLYELNLRINWRLERIGKRFGKRLGHETLVPEQYSQDLTESALAFHWGVAETMRRYAGRALGTRPTPSRRPSPPAPASSPGAARGRRAATP